MRRAFPILRVLVATALVALFVGSGDSLAQVDGDGAPAAPGAPAESLVLRLDRVDLGASELTRGMLRRALRAVGGIEKQGAFSLTMEQLRRLLERLGRDAVLDGALDAEVGITFDEKGARFQTKRFVGVGWDSVVVSSADRDQAQSPFLSTFRRPLRGRVSAARIEEAIEAWFDACEDAAHPFAVASIESLRVTERGLTAGFRLDAGPEVRFQRIEFAGLRHTRPAYLHRLLRWHPAEPFRASTWRSRRRLLESTSLFTRVSEVEIWRDGDAFVGWVELEEGEHNAIAGTLGYAGTTGTWNGFASLDLGNLFGTGRALSLHWERLDAEQGRLRLGVSEPFLGPLPVGARLSLEQEVRDSTYASLRAEALVVARFGFDVTAEAGLEWRRFDLGVDPSEVTERRSTVLGLGWNALGRFRGEALRLRVEEGRSRILPPDAPATRARVRRGRFELEGFLAPFRPWLARARVDLGGIDAPLPIAIGDAWRIGGAGSLRGYREDQFFVRHYALAQLEAGVELGGGSERAYLFVDTAAFRTLRAGDATKGRTGYGAGLESAGRRRRLSLDLGFAGVPDLRQGRLHLRVESRF